MTHDVIVTLAVLGIVGQVVGAALLIVALLGLVGVKGPLRALRAGIEGYELWLAFLVAAVATGGSLFFSEIAHFTPCELCWYQRVCMYPLSITTLLAGLADDHRVARYLLPLPLAGAGVSVYHLLVENGVVGQTTTCLISAPGGCAVKWINEFGYVTIPTLALTAFVLVFAFLALAAFEPWLPLALMSGKQARRLRQQAAAPPPVARKGERRRASPKVLVGVAVVGLALAGAAVGIALAFGGTSSSSSGTLPKIGTLTNALPGAADVQRELRGIPQHGTFLGSSKATVRMIEYIDIQCSSCRVFETETMPSVFQRYVRTGKVRVEARPIVAIGRDSERGVLGSLAAARQNRLFNFAQLLYFNQGTENGGWLTNSIVDSAAGSIPGLDVQAFKQARESSAATAQAKRLETEATADHVTGTPTVYVGKVDGKLHEVSPGLVPDVSTLSAALDGALQ